MKLAEIKVTLHTTEASDKWQDEDLDRFMEELDKTIEVLKGEITRKINLFHKNDVRVEINA